MSYYSSVILGDGPIIYYRANETAGSIIHDLTGNHYDGTLAGSALTYSQAGALSNDPDTALGFGANDTLSLPWNQVDITSWTAITLEFWINITAGWQYIAVTCDDTTTILYLNGAIYTSGSGDLISIGSLFNLAGSTSAGMLDEIAIYNKVLSPARIDAHWLIGSNPFATAALFPATSRRTGILPATARRTGLFPTISRRQS